MVNEGGSYGPHCARAAWIRSDPARAAHRLVSLYGAGCLAFSGALLGIDGSVLPMACGLRAIGCADHTAHLRSRTHEQWPYAMDSVLTSCVC